MRGPFANVTWACLLVVAATSTSAAQSPVPTSDLVVCLVLSERLSINVHESGVVRSELDAIWRPHGVVTRWQTPSEEDCDRLILVKAGHEALPQDVASEAALGWVPFAAGRARRVIYLRPDRARMLVNSMSPGARPEGLTEFMVAKLLGRTLAHELGHVLLNSRSHEASGLMRARFRAQDVLREPTSTYTLNASERALLSSRLAGTSRLAAR